MFKTRHKRKAEKHAGLFSNRCDCSDIATINLGIPKIRSRTISLWILIYTSKNYSQQLQSLILRQKQDLI